MAVQRTLRAAATLLLAPVLLASGLAAAPATASGDASDVAEQRLRDEADGRLVLRRDDAGTIDFVGTAPGVEVSAPGVDAALSPVEAARAHLRRYGPALGADAPHRELVAAGTEDLAAGGAVVRWRQQLGGVPVFGGDAVVTLDDDNALRSVSTHLSEHTSLPPATISAADAVRTAVGAVARAEGAAPAALEADDQGRWVWDPALLGRDAGLGVRGAWRFEVTADDGAPVRHLVLVDDRTGTVLLDADLIQPIERVVCDAANVKPSPSDPDPAPCTTGAARTETSGASSVADVNNAFRLAGATSDFYATQGIDLTDLIGYASGGVKRLASTVRVCVADSSCPYANAFWNGDAMFYGQGYAGADDVVAHEMTHGVIERTSNLIYLDQAGAINESLADIVGEIVDHRTASTGDSSSDWRLGEDLPGGALRSMQSPTAYGQPDRMTSSLWDDDTDYQDAGGVHTNSGVGNLAFYLISQGGTAGGTTWTGIDAGDPTLEKSAQLWVSVIPRLSSFSEYDDLADVLVQTCSDLRQVGAFTAADCSAVQGAIERTEMRSRPLAQPVLDADRSCPTGTTRTVLLDSESGPPSSSFAGNAGWGRTPDTTINAEVTTNAFSGDTAWVGADPDQVATNSLTAVSAVALPAGRPAYLAFRHWEHFDFAGTTYYDGGTVELAVGGGAFAAAPGGGWVNGPTRSLQWPNSGRIAFAGSSRGWVGSRLDLSSFAGSTVRPQFTVRTDDLYGGVGWYLDDIEIWTCAAPTTPAGPVATITVGTARVKGTATVGRRLRAAVSGFGPTGVALSYQWLRNGRAIAGATGARYRLRKGDAARRIRVRVTATLSGAAPAVATSPATRRVRR